MISKDEMQERAKISAESYGGIQPMHLAFYIHAILYAAGRADAAFNRFDKRLSSNIDDAETVASVHEALGHIAAVSRFFFPVSIRDAAFNKLAEARASNLRQRFSVDDDSPLLDRDLRNALEHFDERLDKYLLDDVFGNIFPGPIVNDAHVTDMPGYHYFRLVDPERQIFSLLGQKHEFGTVRSEIRRIADLAESLA